MEAWMMFIQKVYESVFGSWESVNKKIIKGDCDIDTSQSWMTVYRPSYFYVAQESQVDQEGSDRTGCEL